MSTHGAAADFEGSFYLTSRVRLAAFLVPPLTVLVFLYHVLSDLQITVMRTESLIVVGVMLGVGLAAGLLAASGPQWMRVLILSVVAVVWIDLSFPLPAVFDSLTPSGRALRARDRRRIDDIRVIQRAIEAHIGQFGSLPRPQDYGEGMGPVDFWDGWWDVSSVDENQDGRPFMEFLVDRELLRSVPLDPENQPSPDGHPTRGRHYAYFVTPAGYAYEGGQCDAHAGFATYLLGVTDLELETGRPPANVSGSGCECLWKEKPNYFQQHFDYVVCGRVAANDQPGLRSPE